MFKYNTAIQAGNDSVATSTTGAAFVPISSDILPCDEVAFYVPTGTSIDVQFTNQTDNTKFLTISGNTELNRFCVPGQSNHLAVRRTDTSNTPLTVQFAWYKFSR